MRQLVVHAMDSSNYGLKVEPRMGSGNLDRSKIVRCKVTEANQGAAHSVESYTSVARNAAMKMIRGRFNLTNASPVHTAQQGCGRLTYT